MPGKGSRQGGSRRVKMLSGAAFRSLQLHVADLWVSPSLEPPHARFSIHPTHHTQAVGEHTKAALLILAWPKQRP